MTPLSEIPCVSTSRWGCSLSSLIRTQTIQGRTRKQANNDWHRGSSEVIKGWRPKSALWKLYHTPIPSSARPLGFLFFEPVEHSLQAVTGRWSERWENNISPLWWWLTLLQHRIEPHAFQEVASKRPKLLDQRRRTRSRCKHESSDAWWWCVGLRTGRFGWWWAGRLPPGGYSG